MSVNKNHSNGRGKDTKDTIERNPTKEFDGSSSTKEGSKLKYFIYNTGSLIIFLMISFNLFHEKKQSRSLATASVKKQSIHLPLGKRSLASYSDVTNKNNTRKWQTRKISPPISIFIKKVDGSLEKGETALLKATFSSAQNLKGATVSWSFPEDLIEIVSGKKEEVILDSVKSWTIFIKLKSKSQNNVPIFLSVQLQVGKIRLGNVARYHSTHQEVLEQAQQELFSKSQKLRGVQTNF